MVERHHTLPDGGSSRRPLLAHDRMRTKSKMKVSHANHIAGLRLSLARRTLVRTCVDPDSALDAWFRRPSTTTERNNYDATVIRMVRDKLHV
jgi:hypothetical protein